MKTSLINMPDSGTAEFEVNLKDWQSRFNWVEDFHVNPSGDKIAAIVNTDEAEFTVCANGDCWDATFEKAWSLRFSPDSKLMALVANDDEWTVCIDGTPWEEQFDFVWGLTTSEDGSHVCAAIQRDMTYGLAVNDTPWETLYENISSTALSASGSAGGVVQVDNLGQADIDGFSQGIFCVAVEGNVQSDKHMNIWDLCFDEQGKRIAYAVRKDRSRYTIGVDKQLWTNDFQFVWNPVFVDNGTSIVAPVRTQGKWLLYKDDQPFWNTSYAQMWKVTAQDTSNKIAAVVSNKFGQWTVCDNEHVWTYHCDTMISDLAYSENGQQLVAVCKHKGSWDIVANDSPWGLGAEKLWAPVISTDSRWCVTRMEKNKKQYLVVNAKVYNEPMDQVFEPVISPDNSKVIFKSIKDGLYSRKILELDALC
jgi:hypothetical protein